MREANLLDCPFCRKLAAQHELRDEEVVWQFPQSVAFLGPWQFYNGYCVLVSRKHATELSALENSERGSYLNEMCLLAKAIETAMQPHKLNYELLGNQVPHLHWHLFPRYADQADRLMPVWLALDVAERDPAVRRQMEAGQRDRPAVTAALRRQLKLLNAPTV